MHRRRHTLTLIACIALVVPAFGAETSFDGTYTGERVLTKGNADACMAKDKDPVSIVIRGNQLKFTDSKTKDYTISFSPGPDGSFDELSNMGGPVAAIRGHVGGGVFDSDVSSAYCTHHWHLEKQH